MNADLLIGAVCWGLMFLFFFWNIFHRKEGEKFLTILTGGGVSAYCLSGILFHITFPSYSTWSFKALQVWSLAGMLMVLIVVMMAIRGSPERGRN